MKNLTYTRYKSKIKVPKKVNYDIKVNIRFNSQVLNEFKKIVGEGYQTRIRQFVEDYVEQYKKDEYDRLI